MLKLLLSPYTFWGSIALLATGVVAYQGAIVAGTIKGPVMAYFRRYGEEEDFFPLCRFLDVVMGWGIALTLFASNTDVLPVSFAPVSFLLMGLLAGGASYLVRQFPEWRESLPYWYAAMMRETTQSERRAIAYAWLRISRQMRWRFNTDQASFWSWVDLVRLTIIYGARDPDDPWKVWV
jgi:hypothetical protein